jgi:hypothetical protein
MPAAARQFEIGSPAKGDKQGGYSPQRETRCPVAVARLRRHDSQTQSAAATIALAASGGKRAHQQPAGSSRPQTIAAPQAEHRDVVSIFGVFIMLTPSPRALPRTR